MKTNQRWLTAVIVICFTTLAFAQSPDTKSNQDSTIFKKHSLQFKINSYFTLSSFNGSLLSYKYHVNDKKAYRIGISLSNSNYDSDTDKNSMTELTDTTYTNYTNRDYKRDRINFKLSFEWIKYIDPVQDTKLYFSYGPLLIIQSSYTNSIYKEKDSSTNESKSNQKYYGGGITGAIGVEWFFRKNMSLHAEYSSNLIYYYIYTKEYNKSYSYISERSVNQDTKDDTYKFDFNSNSVRFGLSVYF